MSRKDFSHKTASQIAVTRSSSEGDDVVAPLHTDDHPFCFDPSCDCHEEPTFIEPVNQAYQQGELTAQEATDYVNGKLIYDGWGEDDEEE